MSIQDLGALGEFFSAFLILVTLIYLAIQNKQQHKLLLSTVHQARSNAIRDNIDKMAEMAGVYAQRQAGESLTREESIRMDMRRQAMLVNFANTYYQHQLGSVPAELINSSRSTHKRTFSNPDFRAHWVDTPSDRCNASFSKWVEEVLQEIEAEEASA